MRRLTLLVIVAAMAACGPNDVTTGGADAPADAAPDLPTIFPDDGEVVPSDLPPQPDQNGDLPEACEAGEGCLGDPCDDGGDCISGWCVQHMGQTVCTQECVEECPPGWTCQQVSAGGRDVVFICVSDLATLCRPCFDSTDCEGLGVTDLCVSYGDAGSFCGGTCSPDAAPKATGCPEDFTCTEVDDGGAPSYQCVANAEVCDCSTTSILLGLSTACVITNEFGTCQGERTCAGDGLTPCDAPPPGEETCNGLDDDCDGQIDEGFPDLDGDGLAVCVDDEGDGCWDEATQEVDIDCDDVPDSEDNCAADPNPDQFDTDDDGTGDFCDDDDDGDGDPDIMDCAPLNGDISHYATETCNGVDDDCDGQTDEIGAEGCQPYYLDVDTDGYGEVEFSQCLCVPTPPYIAPEPGDCEPYDATVNPGEDEACNNVDDNCNGEIDEDLPDLDEDGIPNCLDDDDDGDGDPDDQDNCPEDFNPAQLDTDDDGMGDACDDDDDGDGSEDEEDCDPVDPEVFPGHPEVCDGKDNDCNDTTDDFYSLCANACGEGVTLCTDGVQGPCSVGEPVECYDYETCETETICDGVCAPAPVDLCNGLDENCDGLPDETFECALAASQNEACGFCGTRVRQCGLACTWDPWGACQGGGECVLGQLGTETCGNCGIRIRTCGSDCMWDAWGGCTGQGDCAPGQGDETGCGLCGTQERTCTDACTWGTWGECSGEGTCTPGQSQSQACGSCGTQTRSCTGNCTWSAWGACSGQGTCSPGQTQSQSCGTCGTQTRSCAATCVWDAWGACTGQGVCSPGTTTSSGCPGSCMAKTCSSSCQWNDACSGCLSSCSSSYNKCGLGGCSSGYHPAAYSCNFSCGSCYGDNQTTCARDCGSSFNTCGLGSCPAGYHASAYSCNFSCGSCYGDNQSTCALNAGSSFNKCGLGGCPAGYTASAYSCNFSCGSCYGDNQTTCTKI
ncbi:MAG: putative metal-binding motif-containing protein [Pseudomonadota bacterium]